ncbi:MAG: endonuclease III [Verrucomicrobiota bacterium]
MPRESSEARVERVGRIVAGLRRAYPDAHCELVHGDPLQLLIATILSAQCTDKRVNLVTPGLFRNARSAADFAEADPAELEREIQSTGFFRNKARNIRACCRALVERHGGRVPDNMEALIELGGVGRKTANVVLGNAFGIQAGIVVDTHVGRLSLRLGLTRSKDPVRVERDLVKVVPRAEWTDFSHLLIFHGRRRCMARNPDCGRCEIQSMCPRIGVVGKGGA